MGGRRSEEMAAMTGVQTSIQNQNHDVVDVQQVYAAMKDFTALGIVEDSIATPRSHHEHLSSHDQGTFGSSMKSPTGAMGTGKLGIPSQVSSPHRLQNMFSAGDPFRLGAEWSVFPEPSPFKDVAGNYPSTVASTISTVTPSKIGGIGKYLDSGPNTPSIIHSSSGGERHLSSQPATPSTLGGTPGKMTASRERKAPRQSSVSGRTGQHQKQPPGMWDRKIYIKMLSESDPKKRDEDSCHHLGDVLKCSHVLRSLPKLTRVHLARLSGLIIAPHGQRIYSRGDVADACYIVLSGDVDLIVPDAEDHSKDVKLSKVSTGHSFGDMALVNPDGDAKARVTHAIANLGPYPKGKDPVVLCVVAEKHLSILTRALKAQRLINLLATPCNIRTPEDNSVLVRAVVDHCAFFETLPSHVKPDIAAGLELKTVDGEETVYLESDPPNCLYINMTALVNVKRKAAPKSESKTVSVFDQVMGGIPSLSRESSRSESSTSHANSVDSSRVLSPDALHSPTASSGGSSPGKSAGTSGTALVLAGRRSNATALSRLQVSAQNVITDQASITIGPGQTFGEKGMESERRARGEVAHVMRGGLLIQLYKSKLTSAVAEASQRVLSTKMDLIRNALNISPDLPMEMLSRIHQLFTEQQYPVGCMLAKQGKQLETFFIPAEGTCTVKMVVKMVSSMHGKTPRSQTADSLSLAREVNKSFVVGVVGAGECVGLVDHYTGQGKLCATYICNETMTVWQAPSQKVLMQIGLLESHHRSAMAESRRLVSKACKLRAQRLKSAAAIMGEQGFELSAADLEIVAGMEAGGGWMTRTGTTTGPKLHGNDHDGEEHMGNAGCPVKAPAGAMTSTLFTDVLFKGTHLAAARNRKSPEKPIAPVLYDSEDNRPVMTKARMEILSSPLRGNPFSPRRTSFALNYTQGGIKHPPGCWLNLRTSRSKDNWVDAGTIRSDIKPKDLINQFANKAAANVRKQREAAARMDFTSSTQMAAAAKDVFESLDVSSSEVALTPNMERWLLHNKIAQSAINTKWQGLSFMPRSGRRPMSRDYVLRSTLENGRMRGNLTASPRRPRDENPQEMLQLSTALKPGCQYEIFDN